MKECSLIIFYVWLSGFTRASTFWLRILSVALKRFSWLFISGVFNKQSASAIRNNAHPLSLNGSKL
eukprot:UN18493